MKRYEIQVDDLEIEPDAIFDTKTKTLYECRSSDMNELCKLLNKEYTKWQKLKEFIKTNIENDEQEYDESKMPMFAHYLSVERFIINKMQELEGEDE